MSVRAELDCDEVIRSFPGMPRPHVQVFSHVKPEVAGIPDRRYYVRGVAIWWEVKIGKDRLTKAQYEFLEREHAVGEITGAGDRDALETLIYTGLPSLWRQPAWDLVLALKARGFRD